MLKTISILFVVILGPIDLWAEPCNPKASESVLLQTDTDEFVNSPDADALWACEQTLPMIAQLENADLSKLTCTATRIETGHRLTVTKATTNCEK